MKKDNLRKFISLVTVTFLVMGQILPFEPGMSWAASVEKEAPSAGFQLDLPSQLGTIQALNAGSGPTVIHIQTAHGNYDSQKQIQAILHHLKKNYGITTLLIEGSAVELDRSRMSFFENADLDMQVAEGLTKKALVKGPELFLMETPEARAYGIENIDDYISNGQAFQAVLTQREKTARFLTDMNVQIERLSSPYLNEELKEFINRINAYEIKKTVPFLEWLAYLKSKAADVLKTDVSDARNQIDWPMMMRIFKLQEYEARIDLGAYSNEKKKFLKAIESLPKDTYEQIEKLLSGALSMNQLPDPETGLLFEKMIAALPASFDFNIYPNVQIYIGHLILQSEMKGERLFDEISLLTDKISEKLAKTDEEKQLLSLFRDHRLLLRLFALELTPQDYERMLSRKDENRPAHLAKAFLEINKAKRVRDARFDHLEEMESLYDKALEFYRWARKRDFSMLGNVEARIRETNQRKVAVVTGGFHATPFREYFESKDYNYALIAPKISDLEGRDAYVQSALLKGFTFLARSTMEDPSLFDATYVPTNRLAALIAAEIGTVARKNKLDGRQAAERYNRVAAAQARSEARLNPPILVTSIFYNEFSERYRKFFAFVPADGKVSIVAKIGGNEIEARALLPNGTFSKQPKGIMPAYVSEEKKSNGKNFQEIVDEKAQAGNPRDYEERKQAIIKQYQDGALTQLSVEIFRLIEQLISEAGANTSDPEAILKILETIDVIGVSSPGAFMDSDDSGVFAGDSYSPPALAKTSIKKEVLRRLVTSIGQNYVSLRENMGRVSKVLEAKIKVKLDIAASGLAEVGKYGTAKDEKNAFYFSWGPRIGGSMIVDGESQNGGEEYGFTLGELGQQMVWFPETQSYGWVAPRTKGVAADSYPDFKGYQTANQRLSLSGLLRYFGKQSLADLSSREIMEAGLETGRMLGAYLKAVRSEFDYKPNRIVLGSVIGFFKKYHPYLIEAVEEGLYQEWSRPLETEIGYRDGLLHKHETEIGAVIPAEADSPRDREKAFEDELSKRYGKFYAENYMRARSLIGEDTRAGKAAGDQAKEIETERQARAALQAELEAIGRDISPISREVVHKANAIKFFRRRRYRDALRSIDLAIEALAGSASRKSDEDKYKEIRKRIEQLLTIQPLVYYMDRKTGERRAFSQEFDFRNWSTPRSKYADASYRQWIFMVEVLSAFYDTINVLGETLKEGDPGKWNRGMLTLGPNGIVELRTRSINTIQFRDDDVAIDPALLEKPSAFVGAFAGLYLEHDRVTGAEKRKLGYTGFDRFMTAFLAATLARRGWTDKKGRLVVLSGGSGAPGLMAPIVTKAPVSDYLATSNFMMANTDDGGFSQKVIKYFVAQGYGIYPPFGDPAQALVKFLPSDLFNDILDDGAGRIRFEEKGKKSGYALIQDHPDWKLIDFVQERIDKARKKLHYDNPGSDLYNKEKAERFEAFAKKLLRWTAVAQKEFFDVADPLRGSDKSPYDGVAIRGIMAIGALKEYGEAEAGRVLLKKRFVPGARINALQSATEQAEFHAAWEYMAQELGIESGRTSFTTTDAATLFAWYEENVLRFRDGNAERVIAVKVGGNGEAGTVIVRDPKDPRTSPVVLNPGESHTYYGVTIENREGKIFIKVGSDGRMIQEEDYDPVNQTYNKTYLVKTDGSKDVELGNNGSGLKKGEKDQKKQEVEQGTVIGGIKIRVIPRLIVTQDSITQTANHSEIINLGALTFGSETTLNNGKVLHANPEALKELEDPDNLAILTGPGSLPTSLLPHLLSPEIIETLLKIRKENKIKLMFIFNPNLDNETLRMDIEKMMRFIERVATRTLRKPGIPDENQRKVKFEELFDLAFINEGIDPGFVSKLQEAMSVKTEARSELRYAQAALPNDADLKPARILFSGPRGQALPLRFEEYGTDFLISVLGGLLEGPVYSEKANVLPEEPAHLITDAIGGEGRLATPTARFDSWMQQSASDKGRLLLDAAGLMAWAKESPRSLYILLSALQNYQAKIGATQPLLAVIGDPTAVTKAIEQALTNEKSNKALTVEERMKVRESLIPQLKSIVQVISTEQGQGYVAANDFGVAALRLPGSQWPEGLDLEADFSFDKNFEADVVAFLVPALLKTAAQIRGIKDRTEQRAQLIKTVRDLIPGATPAPGGSRGFVIAAAQFIQQAILANKLVEASA